MFCIHSSRGEAARLGAVCQPSNCSASLIMHHAGKRDSVPPSLFLVWGWADWGRSAATLEVTGCDPIAPFAFMPGTFTSSSLEDSAYPHWERCRAGSLYCLAVKHPGPFAIGSRSKTAKEKNWLISESQLPSPLKIKTGTKTRLFCTFRKHWPTTFSPSSLDKLMLESHSQHLFLRPLPSVITQHILVHS